MSVPSSSLPPSPPLSLLPPAPLVPPMPPVPSRRCPRRAALVAAALLLVPVPAAAEPAPPGAAVPGAEVPGAEVPGVEAPEAGLPEGARAVGSLPPPTRPALSIKVDDGVVKTKNRQVHTYQVLLRNLGPVDLAGMTLVETLPPGMSALSATGGGAVRGADVSWTVDLPAGQSLTRTVRARVDKLPSGHGLAATACALLADSTVPVVCSTDMDRLPSKAELADAAGMPRTTLYGGIAAALVLAGGTVWFVLRRRRAAGLPLPDLGAWVRSLRSPRTRPRD